MVSLIKIDSRNPFSLQILYNFRCEAGNWKRGYLNECMLRRITPLTQGNLSDFDFFKAIYSQKRPGDLPSTEYILCEGCTPVTSVYAVNNSGAVDLSVTTLPKYQRQGYATNALKMVENDIFSDLNNMFTTITDITKNKISSKIAIKLGYVYYEPAGIYIKGNPYINFEEVLKQKQKRK